MTQLHMGNLSEDSDEKAIRSLFGRYGIVRGVLMKNTYAIVEMDNVLQAAQAMRDQNRTDILGHPMIVEPSHQQRPSKSRLSQFPLRIVVPCNMVGAIIGKDGATVKGITHVTKARVDVHHRENVGSVEKAITIIGTPEACTEACYRIMKIMQNEVLMSFAGRLEKSKHLHFEPLPAAVVPLKMLAHNELVGRVIGKGGHRLNRIMAASGTRIIISSLKDRTAYNMERTVTILGTIDNCKMAESLISAKLRACYESDMDLFMQTPVPAGVESNGSPPYSSLTTKFPPKSSLKSVFSSHSDSSSNLH